ncbi:helix-turn-helix domain-containing protein [Hymenobacter metallicola]|nr:helix-turn-helix domain-containing protein [Hymenobacter metallicola]
MSLISNRPLVIPPAVLALEAPSLNAKALLADILDLNKVSGHVFARDEYFAERYKIGKRSVGDALKWLEDNGWITRELDNSARNKRNLLPTEKATLLLGKSLRISQPLAEEHAKSAITSCEIRMESMRNPQGLHAKSADINTSLNKRGNQSKNEEEGTSSPSSAQAFDKKVTSQPASQNPVPGTEGGAALPAADAVADATDADGALVLTNPKIFRAACLELNPAYATIDFEHYRLEILFEARGQKLRKTAYEWRKYLRHWLNNSKKSRDGLILAAVPGQTKGDPRAIQPLAARSSASPTMKKSWS